MANLAIQAAIIAQRTESARLMREQNIALGWRPVESKPITLSKMGLASPLQFKGYPKPRNLSKRGMHWSASCYPEEAHWRDRMALCAEMGIGFVKFVDDGGASGLNVYRACWHDYGIIPVVRFYIGTPGQCGMRESDAIKRIADVLGFATYFELCNEPDLPIEWGGHQPKDWLYRAVDAYCDYAPKVIASGGLPGTFALASGAFGQLRIDQYGNEIPPTKVNFLKLITDRIGTWVFENGGWVSMHNYHINHPIDYPEDDVNQTGQQLTAAEYAAHPPWAWDHRPMTDINVQRMRDKNPLDTIWDDDTCFGAYKVFLAHLRELGLNHVPILTTEGGPTLTRGDDGRYPKIHIDLMVKMLAETYQAVGRIEQYYCYDHWLLYNTTYGWESDRWLLGAEDYTKAINLFKSTPVGAWGEKFGALPQPPDEPPIEPPPDEEEPPVPTYPIAEPLTAWLPDWNDGEWTSPNLPAGTPFWHVTRAEMLTDNTMDHTLYVDAPEPEAVVKIRNANGVIETLPLKAPELRNRPIWGNDTLDCWIEDEAGHASDHVRGLHSRYWGGQNGVPDGVNAKHLSYKITFRLCAMPGVVTPPPIEPPDEPPVDPPVTTSITTPVSGELQAIMQDGRVVRYLLLLTPDA